MLLLFKAGGMRGDLINVLFCGLLVQEAVSLPFNTAINENPRGNSLETEGALPKGSDSQSAEHFEIKRILPALCMGEPWGSDLWGEMYTLSQCHKNFYDACKGSCGNIMAEWLKGQALKTFCWDYNLGSAFY